MKFSKGNNAEIDVGRIGFGCAPVMSRVGRLKSMALIDRAVSLGIRYFDTADSYGFGGSETLLGEMLESLRNRILISTKVGTAYSAQMRKLQWLKPLVRPIINRFQRAKQVVSNTVSSQTTYGVFERTHLQAALVGSLRRLRTDCIDLYLLHNPSVDVLKRGIPFEFLERAKKEGKIRAYGVSCGSTEEGLAATECAGVSAIQIEVNWKDYSAVEKLLPSASQKGIAIIARAPFANGAIFAPDFTVPVTVPPDLEGSKRRTFLARAAIQSIASLPGVSMVLGTMMSLDHLEANVSAARSLQDGVHFPRSVSGTQLPD